MINFKGKSPILKSAEILERNAKNIYPHISTSRIRTQIGIETPDPKFFLRIKKDYSLARKMIKESGDFYTALIFSLREGKIGNCTEDAMLTELLGKINGQKNIYTGSLGIYKDGKRGALNHVVAFITDEPVDNGKDHFFKNKEAVIIDPWLGITDFAGSYFTKLKSVFRKTFMYDKNPYFTTFTNDSIVDEFIRMEAKTPEEFKLKKKEYLPKTHISIVPFVNNFLQGGRLESIKELFPELILKNYRTIILP